MTLCELHALGFRLIAETRKPVDERGIDGVLILNKAAASHNGVQGKKFFAAAHYAKQNTYGEPVPIPV